MLLQERVKKGAGWELDNFADEVHIKYIAANDERYALID